MAPAALAAAFLTSVVDATTYALPALTTTGPIAPDRLLGLACGLGGMLGGYPGAHRDHRPARPPPGRDAGSRAPRAGTGNLRWPADRSTGSR
ncbi:hypothetical protein [Streptomyces shenzhenensis]|uniref:hypothetical protein n=1 Tax=Streptomyces shenzhenensis TaxID=943815 RepID=UPI0037DA182D